MTSKKTNNKPPVIVVGYDGSSTSRAAVDRAARQAGRRGKVYVVHSYHPPPDWLGFPNYQRVLDDHRARGERAGQRVAGSAASRHRPRRGDPPRSGQR